MTALRRTNPGTPESEGSVTDDLKHFRAEQDGFQLLTPEHAGVALAILLALCLILDRLGVFA